MTDATSYIAIADGAFAPLYPYYARKIIEATGVRLGACLDVGCGGGHLGMALAEQADLYVRLLDKSPEMLRRAEASIVQRHLQARVQTVYASVEAIPLPDASFDLVVSRGSLPFWSDLPTAFREIARVLRPGGHAYLGGGLGPPELRAEVLREARRLDPGWQGGSRPNIPHHPEGHYERALEQAGLADFRVTRGEDGTWVRFQTRPTSPQSPSSKNEGPELSRRNDEIFKVRSTCASVNQPPHRRPGARDRRHDGPQGRSAG